jgi:hypothetical protein
LPRGGSFLRRTNQKIQVLKLVFQASDIIFLTK